MLKIFTILLLLLSPLFASTIQKSCQESLKSLFSSYYQAENLSLKGEKQKAEVSYKKATFHAQRALEQCQDEKEFDFNLINNFLTKIMR